MKSIRHPWRGRAVDPTNEMSLTAREAELRGGEVYLDFSWAFVLRPLDEARTRLLLRSRGDFAPSWLRLAEVAIGAADIYEGMGMLHGIRRRVVRREC